MLVGIFQLSLFLLIWEIFSAKTTFTTQKSFENLWWSHNKKIPSRFSLSIEKRNSRPSCYGKVLAEKGTLMNRAGKLRGEVMSLAETRTRTASSNCRQQPSSRRGWGSGPQPVERAGECTARPLGSVPGAWEPSAFLGGPVCVCLCVRAHCSITMGCVQESVAPADLYLNPVR